ncbi:MAG: hypothetical protein KAQ87_01400 [Candidatus Pacebacteria bacterium]|nr:hypothetical protein [Candidatus Paceibacterota bacterium]
MENSKNDFDSFLSYLKEACESVDDSYIEFNIAGSDWKYRERVYCYELYHQLRCVLGESFPYKLNGEVDKAGHAIVLGKKKPDFIVHVPGEMDKNLVVVEVKLATAIKDEFKKLREDLEKLKRFLNEANYKNAIMLIYGNIEKDLLRKIKDEFKNIKIEKEEQMLLILHQKCGEEPIIIFNK